MMNSRVLKLVLVLIITLIIITSGCFIKVKSENNAKRFYRQGSEFYNKKNYSDAYYNFKQIGRFTKMYRLSLLKQFQCAYNLSDKKTAKSKLNRLLSLTKDENLRPYLLYNEAILSSEAKTDSKKQSAKKFKTIFEKYPNSDFGTASAYRAGKLIEENKNDKNKAKDLYLTYLKKAPDGKFSEDCAKSLINLKINLNKEENKILADALLINKKYIEALTYYNKTPFEDNWDNIAKCYKGLNNQAKEKETIIKGIELEKSSIEEKEISRQIDRLIAITHSDKIQTLQDLYTKCRNNYIFPTVAYKLAENSTSIRSIKLYEFVVENYPNSIWASNSLWEMFWYNYKLSRYKTCLNLAQQHKEQYSTDTDAPRVAYWKARVLLKEKKTKEAKDAFYEVIKEYPLSYYSFLSAKQLKSSKAKKMIIKKPILSYNINQINRKLFKDSFILDLANNNDFETLDDLKINDEYVKSWILHKKQNYPKSITLAKNQINLSLHNGYSSVDDTEEESEKGQIKFSDYRLKLMYPVLYEDEINDLAKEFKQSPYLFLSLIREESHFNRLAKSSVGAIGLTQLMPDTAKFIEKSPVSTTALFEENENIRIGLKYFTYLTDLYKKEESLAILAYNAGPGNINKWLNDTNINAEDIDYFVENIPFLETKNYIKKILSTYWVYLNIYSPRNKGI